MAISGLTLIGESINDSVPSTHALLEAGDVAGIVALAKAQAAGGAGYIDVNVGLRPPEVMAEVAGAVQAEAGRPLSVDSPDVALAEAGLRVCDGRHGKPILNSVSPLRMEMFDLLGVCAFRPVLLASETAADGGRPCVTAEETYEAARALLHEARARGVANEDCIVDPGIAPIGADTENNIHRLMGALRLMRGDADFKGVHASVGLSNFTVMLPARRADGTPVKAPLASAFLTRAMPLGLDMVIGSVKVDYRLLPEGDEALRCFDECLAAEGFDVLMRVQEFYS